MQVKVSALLCIDEHGNYQVLGTSARIPGHKLIEAVERGLKQPGVSTRTLEFSILAELPERTGDD